MDDPQVRSIDNPYEPVSTRDDSELEFNNEPLPKPTLGERMRWIVIVGTPVLFAVANGIRSFDAAFGRGVDFAFEAAVRGFVTGCLVGGLLGLVVSLLVFWATRRICTPFHDRSADSLSRDDANGTLG